MSLGEQTGWMNKGKGDDRSGTAVSLHGSMLPKRCPPLVGSAVAHLRPKSLDGHLAQCLPVINR